MASGSYVVVNVPSLGSAASPAYPVGPNSNYGMFYDAANTALGFSANGNETFRISSASTYFTQPIFNNVIGLYTTYAGVANSLVPANLAGTVVSLSTSGRIAVSSSASFTLNNGYNGIIWNCTATQTVTLDSSGSRQVGDTYTILNNSTGTITISVPSGQTLYMAAGAKTGAATSTNATQGNNVTISYIAANVWAAISQIGTWT